MRRFIVCVALACAFAGCSREDSKKAPPEEKQAEEKKVEAPKEKPKTDTTAVVNQLTAELKTVEDFEEEAEQEITTDNLKEQFAALKKEIEESAKPAASAAGSAESTKPTSAP